METTTLGIILAVFALGFTIAWIIGLKRQQKVVNKHQEALGQYVTKEMYDSLSLSLTSKQDEVVRLSGELARQEALIDGFRESSERDKQQLKDLQEQFKIQFENLANRIFTERANAMSASNAERLDAIIKPFNEKIQNFGKRVEQTYINGTQERSALKEQLELLMRVNNELSDGAVRLTQALKGDSQFQGSWGEIQLIRLLESAGLTEDVHFSTQDSHRDQEGNLLRTDVLIHLPGKKHLILDSKVSLKAFEEYYNSETDAKRERMLKAHLTSIYNHIDTLSDKSYQKVHSVNPPDYVLMFMPLEPAFIAAVQADPGLYERALQKNIAIVSPSTLMATLRTVAYIWKNENQAKNVIDIAREAGALYDKFVGFISDMEQLGNRLSSTQRDYASAMNKLKDSPHSGSTIIGKIERLRKMGAESSKRIPEKFLVGTGAEV